jgi:hypothetical protein
MIAFTYGKDTTAMARTQGSTALACIALLSLSVLSTARAEEKIWDMEHYWREFRGPFVHLSYGLGEPKQKLYQGEFSKLGSMELRLGYTGGRAQQSGLLDVDDRFVFFNYMSSDLHTGTPAPTTTDLTMFRYGIGWREGYAYEFPNMELLPYQQTTLNFTTVHASRPQGLSSQDAAIIDRYDNAAPFGVSTEGGVAVQLSRLLFVHAGYEASVMYPRWVFWQWSGSYIIASCAMALVSGFGREIVKSSPEIGPVMYWILRNAAAYGYYLLLKDNQFWPFHSETPLTAEFFKVGVGLTF